MSRELARTARLYSDVEFQVLHLTDSKNAKELSGFALRLKRAKRGRPRSRVGSRQDPEFMDSVVMEDGQVEAKRSMQKWERQIRLIYLYTERVGFWFCRNQSSRPGRP